MGNFIASVLALIVVLGLVGGVVFGWTLLLFEIMEWLVPFGMPYMISGLLAYIVISVTAFAMIVTE